MQILAAAAATAAQHLALARGLAQALSPGPSRSMGSCYSASLSTRRPSYRPGSSLRASPSTVPFQNVKLSVKQKAVLSVLHSLHRVQRYAFQLQFCTFSVTVLYVSVFQL